MLKVSNAFALLGRALVAVPFLVSGIAKLAAPAETSAYIASAGLPLPLAGYAIAVAVEVGGGLLLLFGVNTRVVAIAMAIFTVATAVAFHTHFADQNQMIHFLKNLMITGGLLQLAAFGGGSFSVDARLHRSAGFAGAAGSLRGIA
jgi:putative oxidoreductase